MPPASHSDADKAPAQTPCQGLQAIQQELQWRRKAALTCRQAAHEAAAAGRRAEYWHLLALTERLAPLSFNGPAAPHYEHLARRYQQAGVPSGCIL